MVPEVVEDNATAQAIGSLLYDQYLLPFEVTSFILLVAVVGAILFTRIERIRAAMGINTTEGK
jgi:NADH-quinone oxidoreductase subunit J